LNPQVVGSIVIERLGGVRSTGFARASRFRRNSVCIAALKSLSYSDLSKDIVYLLLAL
jgi:hypothetical protein